MFWGLSVDVEAVLMMSGLPTVCPFEGCGSAHGYAGCFGGVVGSAHRYPGWFCDGVGSAHGYTGWFGNMVGSTHRYPGCFDDKFGTIYPQISRLFWGYCEVCRWIWRLFWWRGNLLSLSIHAVGGILAMLALPFVGVLQVWMASCPGALTVKFQHCWGRIWRRLDSVSTDGTVLFFAVFTMLAWVVRNWCWFLFCGIAAMLSVVLRYSRCCRVSCNIDDVGMRLAIMTVLSCVLR